MIFKHRGTLKGYIDYTGYTEDTCSHRLHRGQNFTDVWDFK